MLGKPLQQTSNISELDSSFVICYEALGLQIWERKQLWKEK